MGEQFHGFDNAKQVFFYEHDFYVLSNFSAFRVTWQGIDFDTAEHAYHSAKFKVPHTDIQRAIIGAPSAHQAFKIAEDNRRRVREDWPDIKVSIMKSILIAKVNQHEYVMRKLLATGDRELIEDSWRDDFWGWGGPNKTGKNMLGQLWMQIRDELRERAHG